MPVNVPNALPAIEVLKKESIFVMDKERASQQDIRPLKILLLNIMPIKTTTETHILRILSNSPLQIELDLMHMIEHQSKNTPREHLEIFYKSFQQIQHKKYDGLIITGAPVELMEFEEVDYWKSMAEIMEWSKHNVTSTLHICWGAQAGLYYHYGVKKHVLHEKMFGVFKHKVNNRNVPLVRGFDDIFVAPHSRHTDVDADYIQKHPELEIISESDDAGIYIVQSKTRNQIFVTGHSEYEPCTLKEEYERDVKKGLKIKVPKNYFPEDNPDNIPVVRWRAHANLLFSNWLNYYVYQETPYEW